MTQTLDTKSINTILRVEEILTVFCEFLERQMETHYVLSILEELHNYDDAECDGYALHADTKIVLDELRAMIGEFKNGSS